MAELVITDQQLVKRLQEIATREDRAIEEVITSLLDSYRASSSLPGTFKALAEASDRADLRSEEIVDTSSRTKEILGAEFADRLKKRNDGKLGAG